MKYIKKFNESENKIHQRKVDDIKTGVEIRKRGYNTSLGRPKINIK